MNDTTNPDELIFQFARYIKSEDFTLLMSSFDKDINTCQY